MSWLVHWIPIEDLQAGPFGPTPDLAGYPCFYLQPWHPWILLDERELQWMESDKVTWWRTFRQGVSREAFPACCSCHSVHFLFSSFILLFLPVHYFPDDLPPSSFPAFQHPAFKFSVLPPTHFLITHCEAQLESSLYSLEINVYACVVLRSFEHVYIHMCAHVCVCAFAPNHWIQDLIEFAWGQKQESEGARENVTGIKRWFQGRETAWQWARDWARLWDWDWA